MQCLEEGLKDLAGGISILLGINLGTSGGIWLLAAAGQNFSLSPLALPLLACWRALAALRAKRQGELFWALLSFFWVLTRLKTGLANLAVCWI